MKLLILLSIYTQFFHKAKVEQIRTRTFPIKSHQRYPIMSPSPLPQQRQKRVVNWHRMKETDEKEEFLDQQERNQQSQSLIKFGRKAA